VESAQKIERAAWDQHSARAFCISKPSGGQDGIKIQPVR
jgi:hypothetical protein